MALSPSPLAIVQARMGSTRLPRKMLLPLGGKPLVRWATDAAIEAFGPWNVVATIPDSPENDELAAVLKDAGVHAVIRSPRDEADVLGRLYDAASMYRWAPESVIVRVTADDWRKDPNAMRRVASGVRLPVEIGAEAFTLQHLAHVESCISHPHSREHATYALFATKPPPPPPGVWEINTEADYLAACAELLIGSAA